MVPVVIPVEKGRVWDEQRATSLEPGTPIKVVEYDPGEFAEALNAGVGACDSELVVVSSPDVWWQRDPDALKFLADLAWDCDVTYPTLHDHVSGAQVGGFFCGNRLSRENYLPNVACFRREKFLEVRASSGMWDLYHRLHKSGARFKYVPEADAARDKDYEDVSPKPDPVDVRATFYHQATPGTTYWRCALPARYLPGQITLSHPAMGEKDGKLTYPLHEGAAVFQFAGTAMHHLTVKTMRARGVRVLVEVDDDYAHWHPHVMRKAGWFENASAGEGVYSVEGHVATVREADGVIVTTEQLAKQYRPLNKNVYVCPNQIDPADWPELGKPDDGVFRIGWFASASHGPDADLLTRAITWASKQKDVEVVMIGAGRNASGAPWWPGVAYKWIPWSNDFGVYRKLLAQLDVGFAPVLGKPWAQNRSDLKVLENAMAGAVTVASDQPPYHGCEVPGLMKCAKPKDFLRAVQWCVGNKDEVRQLGAEAREYVLAERTVEANIDKWRSAIQE